ncbi:MAG: tRNA lysidine(34) synthetase TilS, partial [Acidobacteriaceae bacterium]|nr:tRNA lysidine(34) synthetase TilS [Acidobacteriaceae bacterium]
QAETVLHRFLRGTGPTGMAAMRLVTADGFIRPLLTTSREEVRQWAVQEGIAWREDSSNTDLRFTRNRLRQQTIPALTQDLNPNLEAVLANTAALAQAEEDYWAREVERVYPKIAKRTRLGLIFPVEALNAIHLALRRRLIRRALGEIRPEGLQGLDFDHIERILALCRTDQGHDRLLVPGADALRSFEWLLLSAQGGLSREPRGYRVPLALGEIRDLPFGAGRICVDVVTRRDRLYDSFKKAQKIRIERVKLHGQNLSERPMAVRNWTPGDELHRSGHQSAEKIKTLFQEHRVRLWERRHWPVLVCGEEIVWVRHFGVAEQFELFGPCELELVYGAEE